jgi:hypothetical protein
MFYTFYRGHTEGLDGGNYITSCQGQMAVTNEVNEWCEAQIVNAEFPLCV